LSLKISWIVQKKNSFNMSGFLCSGLMGFSLFFQYHCTCRKRKTVK